MVGLDWTWYWYWRPGGVLAWLRREFSSFRAAPTATPAVLVGFRRERILVALGIHAPQTVLLLTVKQEFARWEHWISVLLCSLASEHKREGGVGGSPLVLGSMGG